MTRPTYEQAAWSWTEHLRSGGSTPWHDWRTPTDAHVPDRWVPSGAAQLELVRRMACRGDGGPGFTALADLVLSRSGHGRGLAEQPLSWDEPASRRFGPPPVDPADVPVDELLRLGIGVLVELALGATGASRSTSSSVRRRLLTRTPAFVLRGAPVTAAAVRRDLARAGHAEGGRSPQVVILAEPFDYALTQAWSVRMQRGGSPRWHGFLDRWAARRQPPPSTDIVGLARDWAGRVGSDRVHVLAASGSFAEATSAAAAVLGVSTAQRGRDASLVPEWGDLSPAAVDVLRRANGLLGVRTTEADRARAVESLVRMLGAGEPVGHRLTVPERHLDWARGVAVRMADEVRAGGYAVHGRLEELVPDAEGLPSRPRRPDALEVVITVCTEQAAANHERKVAT